MKNKILTALAVLLLGLLFCCLKVDACESGTLYKIEKKLPHYILTAEDADLLLRIGQLEGGCDGVDGIAHVMQVVLNRFESDDWPNTVPGVIFQSGQFTTADELATANITPEAWAALDCVIFGDYLWNEAIYFESLDGLTWENTHEYLFTYKGHDFYK